jgi:hypothetical protein
VFEGIAALLNHDDALTQLGRRQSAPAGLVLDEDRIAICEPTVGRPVASVSKRSRTSSPFDQAKPRVCEPERDGWKVRAFRNRAAWAAVAGSREKPMKIGPLVLLSEAICIDLEAQARALDEIRASCALPGTAHTKLRETAAYLDDLVAASRAVETVDATEAAKRIDKSRQRVHQLVKEEKLRALPKKKGEHMQVTTESIDEFLQDRLDESAP